MATQVARSHGGDGGSRPPPRRPTRIPNQCESSRPRKVRGRGKNLNLEKAFEENGRRPLHLELDPSTFKFVGDYHSHYVRCISNDCARIPFQFKSWDKVPQEFQSGIFRSLRHYFDIGRWESTPHWPSIRMGILSDCQSRFRDRKSRLHRHFLNHGGEDDLETARANPHESHTPEAWNTLIDELFLNPKYKQQCLKNKQNRGKQLYVSVGGSRSFSQYRHVEERATGSVSPIQQWIDMHYREETGWVNETARLDSIRLKEELARKKAEAGDAPVDEDEILTRILGVRRGWQRGIGRKVRRVPFDIASSSSSVSQTEIEKLQAQVRLLTKGLKRSNKEIKRSNKEIAKLKAKNKQVSSSEDEDDYDDDDDDDDDDENEDVDL